MSRRRALLALAGGLALSACASVEPEDATDRPMTYACAAGGSFTAAYSRDGRRAYVTAGGQAYVLRPIPAASGVRYTGGGVTLHAKGPEALLEGAAGGPYRNCRTG